VDEAPSLPFELCCRWSNLGAGHKLKIIRAAFQGGFIPDAILYLSYWYNKHDLPVRMAFFFTMNYLASMITNFLAVGLLEMRGVAGLAGWRWMFLIEYVVITRWSDLN
jgi:hypothetical protein